MIQLHGFYYFTRSLPKFLRLAWCLASYRVTSDRACLNKYVSVNATLNNAPFWHFLHYISLRNLGVLNFADFIDSGEMGFVQQCLSSAVSHSPVVVDVGANRGQFASLVLSLDSFVKVLSYEANPKAVQIYEKNLEDDWRRSKRATIVPKAISNK